jgi:hypothetical protein
MADTVKIARYYDPAANPDGASLPGVPLADLTDEQFINYPAWLRLSIDALPCYRKTAPQTKPTTKAEKDT